MIREWIQEAKRKFIEGFKLLELKWDEDSGDPCPLVEIDMRLLTDEGGGMLHLDGKIKTNYIVLHHGRWFNGRFYGTTNGIRFYDTHGPTGIPPSQFDVPWSNYSMWQRILMVRDIPRFRELPAELLLHLCGIDGAREAASLELEYAERRKRWSIMAGCTWSGVKIDETFPIVLWKYRRDEEASEFIDRLEQKLEEEEDVE